MVIAATLDGPSIPWVELIPILSLLAGTCFLLIVGSLVPTWPRRGYAWVTGISTTVAIVANAVKWNNLYYNKGETFFADAIAIDRFSVLASITICLAVILGALMMSAYLARMNADGPELYALLLTAAIGALVMVSANDLIVLFLGLETLSLSLYLLAASNRDREQSQESGLKYFILGGFSSAFFLYGVALIFGSTGSTKISGIGEALSGNISLINADAMLLVGIGMLLVGLGFKVSAAPFHVWTPDVYEGAPTPVTAFMASAGKVAAFAALMRVLLVGLEQRVDDWRPVVWALAILTVFTGSILAVVQTNVKRMLAYSSISHAGFILVGLEAAGHMRGDGVASSMNYLAIYTVLVMGSFAIVLAMSGNTDGDTNLSDFKGLAKRRPALALAFTVLLFAQAGVPLTAGFVAKFAVIKSAVEANSYVLAVAAMVAAVIGAYLYLRIAVSMWLEEPESDSEITIDPAVVIVIAIAVVATLIVGFFPELLLHATRLARFAPR
ncbi:MAG: NADH-quinone oxidoreductase subunit N [Actinobacteria bacterium]|nr:NADH-quinone oxidoreductase subunit N [Actinomycetota bacterium]